MKNDPRNAITLAMSGASGMPYGLRLLECLLNAGERVYFLLSNAAQIVAAMETDLKLPGKIPDLARFLQERFDADPEQLMVFGQQQWSAPVASGSAAPRAMVVCPCSSACVSAIAQGSSNNLLERAADVIIKERRQLILVHRETPLSAIHLENMLKLARLGVTIMPASPGFYDGPTTIENLVDFMVARILNHLEIPHELQVPWGLHS